MNALPAAGVLRSLCIALLLTSPPSSTASPRVVPPSHPAPEAREREDERESPPQRATREHLESLAADAVAPQVPLMRGFGAGPAGLDWTFLGPRPMTGEYWSGNSTVAGRVTSVAPHPTDPATVYIAAAQGGVWKTTDGGLTWNPLTEMLPSLASGALAVDALAPNTVWYGTGEQNYSGDSFYGDGLYRSTDAGASWNKMATTAQVGSYIARVVLKTGTSDTIFVGGNVGFVRSTDGGSTWATTLGGLWCDDIVVNPAASANLCCAMYGSGIYQSTDAGATWTLTLPLPGRTNLGISPAYPSVIYASASTGPGYLQGVYRSSDGGLTWAPLAGTPDFLDGQGWYDNVVVVSPADSATVLVGGVYPYDAPRHGVLRSTNAGASWTDVTHGVDASTLHPDQHAMAFGPDGTLWVGNDGGVWKSADLGSHWTNCNATLAIAQFYTVATHPTDPSDILGGTQDNGTARFRGTDAWPVIASGDGASAAYQRATPAYFYTSNVKLNPVYKFFNGSYLANVTGTWGTFGDRVDWGNAPLVEDPVVGGTFYVGTHRVYKSMYFGSLYFWGTLSFDLTAGSGALRTIAFSPGYPSLMWTSSSDGAVRRSRDGGNTWSGGASFANSVPSLVPSPADTASAYACIDVAAGGRVVRTTDGGATFVSASGNLPPGVRGLCLVVDWRTTPERLYLGTDYGVYASLDGGTSWAKASTNMPSVAVYAMSLDLANSKLVAATHGRGMWRADLDVTGPALTLTSPVGGEAWPLGGNRTVTWSATDPSGVAAVNLELSLDGGASYPNVIASGLANSGSYSWTVGPTASGTARVRAVATDGLGQVTSAASAADFSIVASTAVDAGPAAFGLEPVIPNLGQGPFHVQFGLPEAGAVSVSVYDATGRRVRTLAQGTFGAGPHFLMWDGHDGSGAPAAPGVYFVRLSTSGRDAVRRLAVIH